MSFDIQPLPPEVVNLIAAGEVIDSLASVVRELVENSLDAGATRITIALFPDLWRVQVSDNGKGMNLNDLRVCAQPHSTSKVRSIQDLNKITSLGFRGEALHSLTQVADLEIFSRIFDRDSAGCRIFYKQGKVVSEEPIAIAPGTIVNVADLFGNWPVRRKGLPSTAQQLKAVQNTIAHIALCHPRITWQVLQNEKLWFKIAAGVTAQDILPQILKQVRLSDLQLLRLEIPTQEESTIHNPQSKIELVIGLPDRCYRQRADWIKVAVNGRVVRSPEIEQTIITGFARTLPRDRYPVCFLHLNLPPSQIDWNRHPAKIEIYLHSLKFWQEQVLSSIEQALRLSPATFFTLENQRVGNLLKVSEEKGAYHLSRDLETESLPEKIVNKNAISLIELKAVAQVNKTYIVAEHERGLWLVEQHIAHERILYEQLQDYWELVPSESPIVLNNLTSKQIEQLQRLGIEVESFGENLSAIRTVPAMLKEREDCPAAIEELSLGGDLREAQVATACRSAIRNGTALNLSQMQTLLDEWKNTRNPRTCPHGRPIYLSLEETSLARFFRRHWVIGKSHGI